MKAQGKHGRGERAVRLLLVVALVTAAMIVWAGERAAWGGPGDPPMCTPAQVEQFDDNCIPPDDIPDGTDRPPNPVPSAPTPVPPTNHYDGIDLTLEGPVVGGDCPDGAVPVDRLPCTRGGVGGSMRVYAPGADHADSLESHGIYSSSPPGGYEVCHAPHTHTCPIRLIYVPSELQGSVRVIIDVSSTVLGDLDGDGNVLDSAGYSFSITITGNAQPQPPVPDFSYSVGTAGKVHFLADSTDPAGLSIFHSWKFGDGGAATGDNPAHTYSKPGRYHVKLTARNTEDRSASVTKTVVVAAPKLAVAIAVVGGPTSIKAGAAMKVDVTVSADSTGVGKLSSLSFDGTTPKGLLPTPADRMSLKSGGPTGLPTSLNPGGHATLHYVLTGGPETGNVTLHSSVKARDVNGSTVRGAGSAAVNVSSDALTVTVIPSKNDFMLEADADGKPKPQTIDVTIKVENTTGAPIDDVVVAPLDLAASDKQHPYEPFPAAVVGANEDETLGTIAPHTAKQTVRGLKITGDGKIDLKSLVTSSDGVSTGVEQLRVGVTTLLEMVVDGEDTRQVRAGGRFVIRGHFTNVTADRTVALTNPVKVLHSGNVLGGGILARADGDWRDADFPPPLIDKLKPGRSVDFQVRFSTARPTPEDYDAGTADSSDWTEGSVTFGFSPRAAVEEDDGSWSALTAQDVQVNGKYPSSIHLKGPANNRVTIDVDTTPIGHASLGDRLVPAGFGLTVGALDAALNRLTDVLGSTVLFTIDPLFRDQAIEQAMQNQALQDALAYLADFAVYLPKADQRELVGVVAERLHGAYDKFTETVSGGIPHPQFPGQAELKDQVDKYLTHLAGAWGRGDPNELIDAVRPVGQVVGETGTDLLVAEATFQGLAELARSPRYVNAAIASWKDERTIAQMKANFPDAARQTLDLQAQELSKSRYPLLEQAFDARRPLADVELGVGPNDDGAGLARQTIAKARRWTKENPNKTLVVIPNEANVAAVRNANAAVGKIENIKPKSMAKVEFELFGGRPSDVNFVILRGDLNSLSTAEVDAIVDKAIARGVATEEDRAVAQQIVDKRKREWAMFNNRGAVKKVDGKYVPDIDPRTGKIKPDDLGIGNLKVYDEAGRIPNQFRGVDNGLPVAGPKTAPEFKIDYYDADFKRVAPERAKYAVPTQESPATGRLVKITGDDDGIFIGQLNGLGLAKSEVNGAYQSLLDVFNHPFSDTWLAKIDKKLEIFSRYFETIPGSTAKGAPLVMFANGEAFAVKIDPYLTRFDTGVNRAYLAFVGAPRAIDPIASLHTWYQVLLDKVRKFVLSAAFLRLFQHQPNAATEGDPIPTARNAKIVRINADGLLEAWTPEQGWHEDPAGEMQAAAGRLAVAPQSIVLGSTKPGDVEIQLSSQNDLAMTGDWFEIDDEVVIDPGGPNEELATVSAFGSLIFPHGLRRPHHTGEIIADLGPRPAAPTAVAATGVSLTPLLGIAAWLLLVGGCLLALENDARRSATHGARGPAETR